MNPSAVQQRIHSDLRRLLPPRLPEYLAKQRWFGGKARQVVSMEITDMVPMRRDETDALLLVIAVHYVSGNDENYAIPVVCMDQAATAESESVLLNIRNDDSGKAAVVVDATRNANFLALLFAAIEDETVFRGETGEVRGIRGKEFLHFCAPSPFTAKPKLLTGEQSNTSVIYDERFILKFFRRIEEGINPELEIGVFLTEKANFTQVPQLVGHLEYRDSQGQPITQGILQSFVPNQGDAWRHILKGLKGFYELARNHEDEPGDRAAFTIDANTNLQIPEFACAALETDLSAAALLGKRTAELHLALASDRDDPAFAPEPFTMEFQNSFRESLRELTSATLNLLRTKQPQLSADLQAKADDTAKREKDIYKFFSTILNAPIHAVRTRIHGDYHLGQVLYTGSDFVIIDFEGEPARPLADRRAKRSPLQDVAGMMRSFHYAAFAPLLGPLGNAAVSADELKRLAPWAEAWSSWFTAQFLSEYFKTSAGAAYLPSNRNEIDNLLKLHLLEKAIYELSYELNNRPTWVGIPLEGIAGLLG